MLSKEIELRARRYTWENCEKNKRSIISQSYIQYKDIPRGIAVTKTKTTKKINFNSNLLAAHVNTNNAINADVGVPWIGHGAVDLMGDARGKSVFVTVGTTSFDKLIRTVTREDVVGALGNLGYNRLRMQVPAALLRPTSSVTKHLIRHHWILKNFVAMEIDRQGFPHTKRWPGH